MEANLGGADLRGANLRGANLGEANLRGANLDVEVPPVNSHCFVSEILWREAKEEEQKDFAGRIRLEVDKCWEYFIELAEKKGVTDWCKSILGKWKEFEERINEVKNEKVSN